jgi:hypothetical protein
MLDLANAFKLLGLLVATASTIWGLTREIHTKDSAGNRRLTRHGKIALALVVIGLLTSIGALVADAHSKGAAKTAAMTLRAIADSEITETLQHLKSILVFATYCSLCEPLNPRVESPVKSPAVGPSTLLRAPFQEFGDPQFERLFRHHPTFTPSRSQRYLNPAIPYGTDPRPMDIIISSEWSAALDQLEATALRYRDVLPVDTVALISEVVRQPAARAIASLQMTVNKHAKIEDSENYPVPLLGFTSNAGELQTLLAKLDDLSASIAKGKAPSPNFQAPVAVTPNPSLQRTSHGPSPGWCR